MKTFIERQVTSEQLEEFNMLLDWTTHHVGLPFDKAAPAFMYNVGPARLKHFKCGQSGSHIWVSDLDDNRVLLIVADDYLEGFAREMMRQYNEVKEFKDVVDGLLKTEEERSSRLAGENEMLKRIIKDGELILNYWSRDCDGCETSGVRRFKSIEELREAEEEQAEWADGPWGYSLPEMDNEGNYILNEEYNGGQWPS